jgi:uncharacterized membrane protein YoaK (UPF0700 family)
MTEQKNYSQFTLEELLAEEKKLKQYKIVSAVFIGFMVGVLIVGVAAKGAGILQIVLPLIPIYFATKGAKKDEKKFKEVQAYINDKKASN